MSQMLGEMSTPGPTSLLAVDGLSVHFGGVKAVNDVSFEVTRGTLYGVIGPNGSGKSTLLAALTRLQPLTTGQMTLEGRSYTSVSAAELASHGVARTFQTTRLLERLSVRENVALGADVGISRGAEPGRGRDARRARGRRHRELVDDAMGRTRIETFARHSPSELPYGVQRRVEIARALAMQPSLLLLDEPTAGMNGDERSEIADLLVELRAGGLTQLLVEHDVPMLVDTCDVLIALVLGEIVTVDVPSKVVQHPVVRDAYLGVAGGSRA